MIRLSNDKLRELAVGCVRVEEDEGLLRFYKYTDEQMTGFGPWKKSSPCCCTTGVKFDFYTNSQKIALSAATAGKYELWVDGVLRKYLLVGSEEQGGDIAPFERFETELTDALGRR